MLFDPYKNLSGSFREIVEIYLKSRIRQIYETYEKRFREKIKDNDTWDQTTSATFAFLDGVETLLDTNNFLGEVVHEAKVYVITYGAEASLEKALEHIDTIKEMTGRDARDIMTKIDNGDFKSAEEHLTSIIQLEVTRTSEPDMKEVMEKARKRFANLSRALWYMSYPLDIPKLKKIVKKAYINVFKDA